MRRRGDGLVRFLHVDGEPATVRAWAARRRRAPARRGAPTSDCAAAAVRADALRARHRPRPVGRSTARFWRDPLLGPVLRRKPWLRPRRRPEPFEALAWAVSEQLIDGGRAVSHPAPAGRPPRRGQPVRRPARRARARPRSPAPRRRSWRPAACRPRRAITMVKAAREVASGPRRPRHATSRPGGGCGRSRASARGRSSAWPCTARAATTSCPRATWPTSSWSAGWPRLGRRATEDEVREFFAPYAPFAGLAGHRAGARRWPRQASIWCMEARREQDRRGVARASSRPSATTCCARRAPSRPSPAPTPTPRRPACTTAAPAATSCSAPTPSSTPAPAGPASPSPRSPRTCACEEDKQPRS